LHRQRLQRERLAKAGPDGRRSPNADILARERPALGSLRWGKHIPGQNAPVGRAERKAEFANRAEIMLPLSARVNLKYAAVPLALTLRKVKLGGAAPMGH
jgi:hypothetical protein